MAASYPDWTHSCHETTSCDNTNGSYHCACNSPDDFGQLWSGSVKHSTDKDYTTSFGLCHGYGSSEGCCGDAGQHLSLISDNLVECSTKECMRNCRHDFKCVAPCDGIKDTISPRSKAIAESLKQNFDDDQNLRKYSGERRAPEVSCVGLAVVEHAHERTQAHTHAYAVRRCVLTHLSTACTHTCSHTQNAPITPCNIPISSWHRTQDLAWA